MMGTAQIPDIEIFRKVISNLGYISPKLKLLNSTFRFLTWTYFMYDMQSYDEMCMININTKIADEIKGSITKINNKNFAQWNNLEDDSRSKFFGFWSRIKKINKNTTKATQKTNETKKVVNAQNSSYDPIKILNTINVACSKIHENIRLCKIKKSDNFAIYDPRLRFEKIRKRFLRSIINGNGDRDTCFSCELYKREVVISDNMDNYIRNDVEIRDSSEESGISSIEETDMNLDLHVNRSKKDFGAAENASRIIIETIFETSDFDIFAFKTFVKLDIKNNEYYNIINEETSEKLELGILQCYKNGALQDLISIISLIKFKKDFCGLFLISKIVSDLYQINIEKRCKILNEFLEIIKSKFKSFYFEIDYILQPSCSDHQSKIDMKKLKIHFGRLIEKIWGFN